MKLLFENWRRFVALHEATMQEPIREPLDLPVPDDLIKIYELMKQADKQLYIVGGAVRDTILGKAPKDYDLATDAKPEEVMSLLVPGFERDPTTSKVAQQGYKKKITGRRFPVVTTWTPESNYTNEYEIATFRKDVGKGRRPEGFEFTTIEEDVKRRDLTINALFYDIGTGQVVDYVGGLADLKSGTIRAVGDPSERFSEDPLRTLRTIRFAARMGSKIEPETREGILANNDLYADPNMSKEAVTEEFKKGIVTAKDPEYYIHLARELGLLSRIFPGLMVTPAKTKSRDLIVQLALLLRENGEKQAAKVLKDMRYSGDTIKATGFLISLLGLTEMTAPGLKKQFRKLQQSQESTSNQQWKAWPIGSSIREFASAGGLALNEIEAFLQFAVNPVALSSEEARAQGLKGIEMGRAMAAAEQQAYIALVGGSQ